MEDFQQKDNISTIDLYDVTLIMWKNKFLALIIISFFSIASIFYSLSLENYYKSSALLGISADQSQESSLSQYAGLASVVGVNLPMQSSENKTDLAIETLKSRDFFKHLIDKYEHFLKDIFAAKSYDIANDKFIYNSKIYDEKNNNWVRKVKYPMQPKPSYAESHDFFMKNVLKISHNIDTGYITLSIEHLSPKFAKNLIEIMVTELNNQIRIKDNEQANKAVEYLLNERNNISIKSITESIDSLIESQLRTLMLSEIKDDYILKVIDSPHIPIKKSKPSRATICLIGFLMGFFLSVIFVLINHFRTENPKQ